MRKKKILATLFCIHMGCICLAGCEKTPEEAIVREKGADSIKAYESAGTEHDAGSLRETLGAPEHYQNEASYEDGRLVIDTDADVVVPDVDAVNTYTVSAKEADQELIDTVTEAFFEGAAIYHGYEYDMQTKEDYQKRITILKKYKAEGNLDPYDYGRDENGELQFDIDKQIQLAEERMQTAPDEIEKVEVTPSLYMEYQTEKGTAVDEGYFGGVAETADGAFTYDINYMLKPDLEISIKKRREDRNDPEEFSAWTKGEYLMDSDGENHISEEAIQSKLNITYEEAKKIAEEKIGKLGWDLKMYGWDYCVYTHGEGGAREDNMLDAGYQFYFTREFDGVPVIYTVSYGGGLEDMDSTLVPWRYEVCEVIVGDDGIQEVLIMNPYQIGEVQTEHVKLMDFDRIAGIYEQMMEVSNTDITKYEAYRSFHIRRITFGYARIYDPTKDNDTGLLVPVWDFFGGFDTEDLDGNFRGNSGEHSTQSFMTINAIDGTVINRELGY